jgi:hypothetical protein
MMKKAIHKLQLHREIIRDFQALDEHAIKHVRGGADTVMASDLVPETNHLCTGLAAASPVTR